MKRLKLGSLFDGSGGFPLAGVINGIEPIWSSEIEPYPLKVTALRFPTVKQLGDVTKIDGAAVEPVDIITFGSPCQDLSVAGKQAGIHNGERSNLFFEAIRIIKEMRNGTANEFPRWAVWENVPGAFSSNGGEDFRAVIEALAGVVQDGLDIPRPARWAHAGGVAGNGWSLAWRVYDARHWGVPQRRKRIYLIADFRGERAGEILFERESVSGDFEASGKAREGTASGVETGAGAAGFCTEHSAASRSIGYADEESPTLRAGVVPGVVIEYNPTDARIKIKDDGICQTLTARCGTGGNNVPLVGSPLVYGICSDQSHSMLSDNPNSGIYEADTSRTLDCNGGSPVCNQGGMAIVEAYGIQGNAIGRKDENGPAGKGVSKEKSYALTAADRHAVAMNVGFLSCEKDAAPPLLARDYKDPPVVQPEPGYLVRRLTPLECCRLQGFPDWWEDGAGGSDSARYKMWGNGIALPCAVDVLRRIAKAEDHVGRLVLC